MAPKFIQAKKTTVYVSLSASDTSIVLKNLLDLYGNELAMSDFGDIGYITIDPGLSTEEIISFTDFSVDTDGTVTLSGVTRALVGVSPYGSGGTASAHNPGAIVVVSNNPQTYEAIIDYIDGIALAGTTDATLTGKGIVEVATTAEIDADTETGSTGAILSIDPSRLALSKYGLRLPSADEKAALAGGGDLGTPSTSNKFLTEESIVTGVSKKIATSSTTTVVGNTATETAVFSTTIPGGLLSTNNAVKFTLYVSRLDAANDDLTIRLKLGSTTIATITTTDTDGSTGQYEENLDGYISGAIIAAGATNSQLGNIQAVLGKETTPMDEGATLSGLVIAESGVASEDSTGDLTLSVTVQWSGSGLNYFVPAGVIVELIS